ARGVAAGRIADVLAGAEQADHGAREIRKQLRRGGFSAGEELRERGGAGRSRQLIARCGGELADAIPSLRRSNDTPQRWKPVRVEKRGRDAVGGDHQVLDERLRAVGRDGSYVL